MSPYEKEQLESWFRNEHSALLDRVTRLEQHNAQLMQRLARLETQGTLDAATIIKSQAGQQQATTNYQLERNQGGDQPNQLYAPLRNDTKAVLDLAAFARRLLNPEDLAHAVTFEVRNAARRALGLREVEAEDL